MPRSIIEDIQALQGLLGVGRAGRMQQLQEREQTAKVGQSEQLLENLRNMSPEQLALLKQQVEAGGINNRFLPQEKQAGLASTQANTEGTQARTQGQLLQNQMSPEEHISRMLNDVAGRGLQYSQAGNVDANAAQTRQGTQIEGDASNWAQQNFGGAPNPQMVNAQLQNQQMANQMKMEQDRMMQQKQSDLMNFGAMNPQALGIQYGQPDSGMKAAFEQYFPKVQGPPAPGRSPDAQRLLGVLSGKGQSPTGPQAQTANGPAGISDLISPQAQLKGPTGGSFLGGWEYGQKPTEQQPQTEAQYTPMGNPPELPQEEPQPKTLADRVDQFKKKKILPKVNQIKNRPLIKIGPQQ